MGKLRHKSWTFCLEPSNRKPAENGNVFPKTVMILLIEVWLVLKTGTLTEPHLKAQWVSLLQIIPVPSKQSSCIIIEMSSEWWIPWEGASCFSSLWYQETAGKLFYPSIQILEIKLCSSHRLSLPAIKSLSAESQLQLSWWCTRQIKISISFPQPSAEWTLV